MTLRTDRDKLSEELDTMTVARTLYDRKILGEEDFHRIADMVKSGADKVETNGHLIDIFLRPSMKRHTDVFLDIVHREIWLFGIVRKVIAQLSLYIFIVNSICV